jgi:signal transduction histidine kinase
MTRLAELPIRARITAAFATVMVALLAGIGASLYWAMGTALLDEIDSGLRFRAASMTSLPQRDVVESPQPALEEPRESFDQLVAPTGALLRTTPGLGQTSLLTSAELAGVRGPRFFERQVHGVVGRARLLAVPLTGSERGQVLIVGTTMADRTDALRQLSIVLAVGGAVAVGVASLAGWAVAGLALRPVERMRGQASAITASGLDRRLELPRAHDELHRLAQTLNVMLQRLDDAATGERRFLEQASHELRTPLAALQAELELARSPGRTAAELSAAVDSAAEETDRLVRLANDLLILARTHGGALPIRREVTDLGALVTSAVALFEPRAGIRGQRIELAVAPGSVRVDPVRVRQVLDNLLDNALRHAPDGGSIHVNATIHGDDLRISVEDSGPGFQHPGVGTATAQLREDPDGGHAGLGLRIVESVAAGHGGGVDYTNAPGAVVVVTLADVQPG